LTAGEVVDAAGWVNVTGGSCMGSGDRVEQGDLYEAGGLV